MIVEYHPVIYKICRVYSSDQDFEDLFQEVLISLWKSHDSFEGRSKLSTWIYRVALNTALTYQRKASKLRFKTSSEELPNLSTSYHYDTKREEQVERLYRAISQLKKDERSIILLYLEEKQYNEIAEITGLTTSNIGVRINRIKKKLFHLLNTKNHG